MRTDSFNHTTGSFCLIIRANISVGFAAIILIGFFCLYGCDFSRTGSVYDGHSSTKDEAVKNGSAVELYTADRSRIRLLNNTTILLDTAWTEVRFVVDHGKTRFLPERGFQLSIPSKGAGDDFMFEFELLDKSNEDAEPDRTPDLQRLYIARLTPVVRVKVTQRDLDTAKGWQHPIMTDTIIFTHAGTYHK